PHNLVRTQSLPANAAFVVIAAPQHDLLAGEVAILKKYVEEGGNLLWLHDPGGLRGLQPLEELLGIRIHEGTVVDANQTLQALLGINHPAVVPVVDYSNAEVVRKLAGVQTLFPFATAVERDPQAQSKADGLAWQADEFLMSLPTSWLESSGTLEGSVKFDAGSNDKAGPVSLGVTLTRQVSTPRPTVAETQSGNAKAAQEEAAQDKAEQVREQRIAVVGDSDFMLNAFLAQGANLDLATNLFNWLSADDNLLQIPLIRAPDTELVISETSGIAIGVFFLVVLPLSLLLTGVWIWWRRRSR
ncbi:MAG: ABC transporter, partial [Thiothrix sp.]